jgi:hypothetical protein
MPRSESLYIPEVQRAAIRQAKQEKDPYARLASEQRVLHLWLQRRFQVFDEEYAKADLNVRMRDVEREVGIAYVALSHAYREATDTSFPKVEDKNLIDFFQAISPGVTLHAHTGKPLSSPPEGILQGVVDIFSQHQAYLSDRFESRFDNPFDKDLLAQLDGTFICASLTYYMLESQLALQNEGSS